MLESVACEVVVRCDLAGIHSMLTVSGVQHARDFTPATGPESVRNHCLAGTLPDGTKFEVEAGYINWVTFGIAVSRAGTVVHRSHPGRQIAYPSAFRKLASQPGPDMTRFKENRVPILVDLALGLLFFVVAKLTDLSTAAIVGAAIGLGLLVLQRFIRTDILGGLALFGVAMLLVSAGLAMLFQDDMAVKQRSTIVGAISAVLFLGDGLLGGNRLGKGLARYLPYGDIDPGRLAVGMGVLGFAAAILNYGVARLASTDAWLFYTTFGDIPLSLAGMMLVFGHARGRLLRPGKRRV